MIYFFSVVVLTITNDRSCSVTTSKKATLKQILLSLKQKNVLYWFCGCYWMVLTVSYFNDGTIQRKYHIFFSKFCFFLTWYTSMITYFKRIKLLVVSFFPINEAIESNWTIIISMLRAIFSVLTARTISMSLSG